MNKTGIKNSVGMRHGRPDNFCMVAKETDPTLWNVNFNRPIVVQRKLNGIRAILLYNDSGLAACWHRSGLSIKNTELILKASTARIFDYVIDCEIYAHGVPFDNIRSAVQTSHKPLPPNTQIYIFDAIKFDEWFKKNTCDYNKRMDKFLDDIIQSDLRDHNFFNKIESYRISSKSKLLSLYDRFLNEGYEGLMIKYLDEPYHWGKTDAILKLKPGR